MKKFAIIASIVALVGVVAGSMVNSFAWLHQPKTPIMFK